MVSRRDLPPALLLASAVAVLQGMVLLLLAVLEVANLSAQRLGLGITVAIFFACYASLLLAGARGLVRADSWARGPVLLTQLICLGVAWSIRSQAPLALVAGLVVVAVAGLVGLLHPASVARLARG